MRSKQRARRIRERVGAADEFPRRTKVVERIHPSKVRRRDIHQPAERWHEGPQIRRCHRSTCIQHSLGLAGLHACRAYVKFTQVIANFADRAAEDIFHGVDSKTARAIPRDLWPVARRKLDMLNAARIIEDLRIPPANRLEKLKGDLAGRYSVRINDQFRIVFRFDGGQAHDVTIVDYH